MVNPAFVIISVILSITVAVSSLQCYVCYDCVDIKDEYIQSCDDITNSTTTAAPSTSTTTTTTVTPTSSTTETPSTSSSATTSSTSSTTSTTTSTTISTTTTTEAPTSNSSTTTEATPLNDRVEGNYECFQGKIHVNNSDVIIRGCAVGRTNETCESFGLSTCSFCGTDKCNSAVSIRSSAIVLISVFFFTLVFKE